MTTAKEMASIKEARELYDLKERAAKFYAENGVPQKMEDVLNSMFYDNPGDVYGHLANYFQAFAKQPVMSKFTARRAVDGKGQNTIQTDIYCTINNKEKLVCSSISSSVTPAVGDTARPEDIEEEARDRDASVDAAINIINTQLAPKLQGLQPTDQTEIDNIISGEYREVEHVAEERRKVELEQQGDTENGDMERKASSGLSKQDKPKSGKAGKGGKGGPAVVVVPDEPREKMEPGSVAVYAASQAVCVAAAHAHHTPLYEYIATLHCGKAPADYRIPLPMVTIFQSGRAAPGKANSIKEYMLVPCPGKPLAETVPQIVAVYNDVVKAILGKNGGAASKKPEKVVARNVTDIGALMMAFDRPEQGLDMIQESLNRLGLIPGEDFYLALNLAGHEIFDYDPSAIPKDKVPQSFPLAEKKLAEKGKYEVITGQQKVAEDMVDYWVDIVTRYPAIIALIDPLRKQEDKAWMLLCEKLSEKCYIIGDHVWHRPGLLKSETLTEEFRSSANVYHLEQLNTISDIIECAHKMEDAGYETVLSTNIGETTDTFISDMAVGLRARFLKVGAPCRGERVAKLNRLVSIEAALQQAGGLATHGPFTFPTITVPVPPEPEEGEPTEEETKESPRKK